MDDVENDDIAAAMGFSSFGATKKRKYDQTNSPKPKADASGANTTRLGVRPKAEHPADNSQEASTGAVDTEASSRTAESHDMPATNSSKQKQEQPGDTGLATFLARGKRLPERSAHAGEDQTAAPPPQKDSDASFMVSFGGPAISQAELAALRKGVLDENGDRAYFLPSFVGDPWDH